MADINAIDAAIQTVQNRFEKLQSQIDKVNLLKFEAQRAAPEGYAVDFSPDPFGGVAPSLRFIGDQDPRLKLKQAQFQSQLQAQTDAEIARVKALGPVETDAAITKAKALQPLELERIQAETRARADAEMKADAYKTASAQLASLPAAFAAANELQGPDRDMRLNELKSQARSAVKYASTFAPEYAGNLAALAAPYFTPQEQLLYGLTPGPGSAAQGASGSPAAGPGAPQTTQEPSPAQGAPNGLLMGSKGLGAEAGSSQGVSVARPSAGANKPANAPKPEPRDPLIQVGEAAIGRVPEADPARQREVFIQAVQKYSQAREKNGIAPALSRAEAIDIYNQYRGEPITKAGELVQEAGAEQQAGSAILSKAAPYVSEDGESPSLLTRTTVIGPDKKKQDIVQIRDTPLEGDVEPLAKMISSLKRAAGNKYKSSELPALLQSSDIANVEQFTESVKSKIQEFSPEQHGDTLTLRVPLAVDVADGNGDRDIRIIADDSISFYGLKTGDRIKDADFARELAKQDNALTLEGLLRVAEAHRLFVSPNELNPDNPKARPFSKVRLIVDTNLVSPEGRKQLPERKQQTKNIATAGLVPRSVTVGTPANVFEFGVE